MPRDVSLSDSKCWNGGHAWVNTSPEVEHGGQSENNVHHVAPIHGGQGAHGAAVRARHVEALPGCASKNIVCYELGRLTIT